MVTDSEKITAIKKVLENIDTEETREEIEEEVFKECTPTDCVDIIERLLAHLKAIKDVCEYEENIKK
jgi:hypothetical protein